MYQKHVPFTTMNVPECIDRARKDQAGSVAFLCHDLHLSIVARLIFLVLNVCRYAATQARRT